MNAYRYIRRNHQQDATKKRRKQQLYGEILTVMLLFLAAFVAAHLIT